MAAGNPAPDEDDEDLEGHVDRLLAELRSAYFELFAAIISSGASTADSTADSTAQEALT